MSTVNEVLEKSRSDSVLRQRLKTSPREVLRECGSEISSATRVEVIESRPNEIHLTIGGKDGSPELVKLLQRAAADEAFGQRLKKEPRRCVEETFGNSLPEHLQLVVHDQPKDVLRLFLPPVQRQVSDQNELSDLELSAVRAWATMPSRTLPGALLTGFAHELIF